MMDTEPEDLAPDVAAQAAAALEEAESGDDEARLAAVEQAHAALEEELERPASDAARD